METGTSGHRFKGFLERNGAVEDHMLRCAVLFVQMEIPETEELEMFERRSNGNRRFDLAVMKHSQGIGVEIVFEIAFSIIRILICEKRIIQSDFRRLDILCVNPMDRAFHFSSVRRRPALCQRVIGRCDLCHDTIGIFVHPVQRIT